MIIQEIRPIIQSILDSEIIDNHTKEVLNSQLTIRLDGMDWDTESEKIKQLFKEHGLSFEEKYHEEEYHYYFLQYALLQKIRAVKYFHDQGLDSRKIVIFSEDCISLIQWISRPKLETNFMNVYIRSSDAFGLLPLDILYLCRLGLRVTEEYKEIADFKTILSIQVASCHIYINEDNRPTTRDGVEIQL